MPKQRKCLCQKLAHDDYNILSTAIDALRQQYRASKYSDKAQNLSRISRWIEAERYYNFPEKYGSLPLEIAKSPEEFEKLAKSHQRHLKAIDAARARRGNV